MFILLVAGDAAAAPDQVDAWGTPSGFLRGENAGEMSRVVGSLCLIGSRASRSLTRPKARTLLPRGYMASIIARTALLMSALLALLGIGGWLVGGMSGLTLMLVVGLAINLGSYWFSDRLALSIHRARPVSRAEFPELYAIVERLARRSDMPVPSIHVIPSASPNAFATGRGPGHAAVAVTEGLLGLMNERELEGVLAHELSHVKNRDVLVATIAAAIAGVISTIGYILQWGLLFGSGDRDDRRGGSFAVLAWVVVAPIIALLLQLAISRAREYGADASGARLTHDPDALADALSRLHLAGQVRPYELAGPATAHLFILNPLQGRTVVSWLSTHPPIEDRIARLRTMRQELSRTDVPRVAEPHFAPG
jgi:heat shock protein HtpX